MSHHFGTDLGGIRDVQGILERCILDEITECWHWTLSSTNGSPKVHFKHPVSGKWVSGKGRRVALILARGKDLPRGHVAYARLCCQSKDCCNPDHCQSGTKAKWGAFLTKTGRVKSLPSKVAASRKGWDTRGRKITPEMVADIRSRGDESAAACARRLGVSAFAVWSVDTQQTHRPLMRGASVFNFAGFAG